MKSKLFIIIVIISIYSHLYSGNDGENIFYSRVIETAKESVGLKSIPASDGRTFTQDCIGFVRYVYLKAGLDLLKAYGNGRGGVSSLYDGLAKRGLIYTNQTPSPGDLIFFDNTYDVNKDGKWDDPLSHIAIVESIGRFNTIYYIDFSNNRVSEERLNLLYPNTHAFKQKDGELFVINSFLRRDRGEGLNRKDYVASFFFRSFAHINVRHR